MPNTSSARKEVRASVNKQLRNKRAKSLAKTSIIKAEEDIFAGDLKAAEGSVAVAVKALDKASEKGILRKNNAARRKSRLVIKLNKAKTAPAAE